MDNPNSLGAFVRSFRRASRFADMRPRLRRVLLGSDEEVTEEHRHLDHHHDDHREGRDDAGSDDVAVVEDGHWSSQDVNHHHGSTTTTAAAATTTTTSTSHDVTSSHADEGAPLLGNRGESRSSSAAASSSGGLAPLRTKLSPSAQARVEEMTRQRDETRAQIKHDEREPLLITKIQRDDGTEAEVIVGQSTLPQTIFNSSNVLVGVGLLSLPLAFRYAGWVIGMLGLFASSVATKYTAGLLAKCLDVDSSLANFADIAFVAFGERGRLVTSALITLELLVTCVGLVILFADTLESLIHGPSKLVWKILCGCLLAPLNFLPMSWLGYSSFLGIVCSLAIILVGIVAGALNPRSPGSLREVATTHALPPNWRALPLCFGLIMALWTGHSVFPNIYRDMRHPPKYSTGLKVVFGFVTSVDIVMAVVGYLLYGNALKDELTTNMIETKTYSMPVKILTMVLMLIVCITKYPLQSSPIVSTLEVYSGVDERAALLKPNRFNRSKILSRSLKAFFRLFVTFLTTVLAIAIPSFELMSALMGGFFGYLICIIVPVCFHLKMFRRQITPRQMIIDWALILLSAVLGIVGTVWEFLPQRWINGG